LALVRIDLHTHSTASDGTDPPAQVMRRAAAAGLDVVALTDHDTLAGHREARDALPPGLALLTGMELSCRLDDRSVHMLAYGVDPGNAELAAETAAIVAARVGRAQSMVEALRGLGVDITWPQVQALAAGGVVGRPHIARAMVAAGAITSPDEAFTADWIGAGGRAYVSRYALDPVAAIGLIRAAGGVAVLAHPRAVSRAEQLSEAAIAELAAVGLAGLEVAHPDQDRAVRQRLAALAASLDLVATGGSDDHGSLTGYRIGCETTSPQAYERLMSLTSGDPA
jgi:3',5'-nucleoside bisphosphate phosphatase